MPTETSDALAIGQQLADLCNQGKNLDAINALYADNIVSVEAVDCGSSDMPQTMTGIDAVRGKNKWWSENHEVHSGEVKGPFPHGDRFILIFKYDVTPKCGPAAGNRTQMVEAGLFTTDNGKITKEEFFYHMGG
jgi:Zn ribbon nucleic-acid-binding protein